MDMPPRLLQKLPVGDWQRLTKRLALPLLVTCALLGQEPAIAQEDEEFFEFDEEVLAEPRIPDPFEGINRACFAFNDVLYRVALKPLARGLRLLPVPVVQSFNNFFINLQAPMSAFSALLQGDGKNAASELARFLLNSTAGAGGLLDPATRLGLMKDEEDLGQTLGRYGLRDGPFLVLPLYGSTSVRDLIGAIGTNQLNPLYSTLVTGEIIGINSLRGEVLLALDNDSYEAFYASSLDPYVFFRSAWVQSREGLIAK